MLYLIVLGRGLSTVYRLAVRRRDPLSIAVLGVAGATLFQWLNGDLYSVAWLFWLTLGWADRQPLRDNDGHGNIRIGHDPVVRVTRNSEWAVRGHSSK